MAAGIPLATEIPGVAVNWRRLVAVALLLACVCLLYLPTLHSLQVVWRDTDRTTYTHGFLIVAICLWLLWRARAQLTSLVGGPADSGTRVAAFVALLCSVLMWQWAYRSGIQLGQQLLLPVILWLAVLLGFGRQAARAACLPLGFLYFAVPVWDALNPAAVTASTKAVQFLLRLVGVPAHFEGNTISVPSGQFEIEGGCSGLHYIVVALALAVLLGELRGDRWRSRLMWVLVAVVLAILINWLRVFIVILAGHFSHMQHYLVRESHYGFGWALFALLIIAMLLIDRRLAHSDPGAPATATADPSRHSSWRWQAASVVTLTLPLLLNLVIARDARANPKSGSWPRVVPVMAGCEPSAGGSTWQPVQQAADFELRARYQCDGVALEFLGAWYGEQLPRKKLGGYDNRLEGDALVVESGVASIDGRQFRSLRLEHAGRQSLLWVIYRVGDREFTSATRAQLWYGLQALRSLGSPVSAVVALHADCAADCSPAQAALGKWVTSGGIP